jgi:hypothetical protein
MKCYNYFFWQYLLLILGIFSPFHVKIPKGVTSRLGHIGESYQISQWYPKPAVYDRSG